MTPLPMVAAAFVLGLLAGLPLGPGPAAALALLLALGGLLLSRRSPGGSALALLAAAYAAGATRRAEVPCLVPRGTTRVESGLLRGRVVQGCTPDEHGARCVIERDDGSRVALRVPPASCAAQPGDRIAAVATLRDIAPMSNGARAGPGASLALRGITIAASAAGCERDGSLPTALDLARRAGLWVRALLGRGLERALEAPAAAHARALLFGDGANIDEDDLDAFRESGLAHLLAVSGAHVALLAALLGGFTRAVLVRIPSLAARGLAAPLATLAPLPLLTVFVLATGESPSALRALTAAVLSALAALGLRRARAEPLVAASVLVTLAAAPALVRDPGWQLSVVAAWALASAPHAESPLPLSPTLARSLVAFWREALSASVRVAIAATPVLAWHFRRAPALAVAANALAAPLAEALGLPLVLAAALAGACAPLLGRLLGLLAACVLDALFAMPRLALSLPLAALSVPPPTLAQVCALVGAALVAVRVRGRARAAIVASALAWCAALELGHLRGARPLSVLRLTALDVGQGDAILVDLPDGAAMLVDGGGERAGAFDPGERVVVPFLADRRRRDLAVVVASHPHPDHVGGLAAVLRWARVRELWDTRQGEAWHHGGAYSRMRAAARERGIAVRGPEQLCGMNPEFHGARLEVLWPCPAADPRTPPNDASFVLRLTYGRASVLLPGDLERAGESALLPSMAPVTLLKVGHHGSRTSTSEALLDVLRPRVALISAGHPSPFEHPHTEVLARLVRRGVEVWSTAVHGGVAITLRANGSWSVAWGARVLRGD